MIMSIFATTQNRKIHSQFELEDAILDEIKQGYVTNPHTAKLISAATGMRRFLVRGRMPGNPKRTKCVRDSVLHCP
jgi:hypothetical protein